MTFVLSMRSRRRMTGVHTDLVRLVEHAIGISTVDFLVLEGLRTPERQQELLAAGASRTLRSRHLTGHAVDLGALVKGELRWDWPLYHQIAAAMKNAAQQLNVPVEWGGDWRTFKDGPHFQLPWKEYP
jgi:peptidoglycan L-alanyl-D-glutamate endopeptidase CwlK